MTTFIFGIRFITKNSVNLYKIKIFNAQFTRKNTYVNGLQNRNAKKRSNNLDIAPIDDIFITFLLNLKPNYEYSLIYYLLQFVFISWQKY